MIYEFEIGEDCLYTHHSGEEWRAVVRQRLGYSIYAVEICEGRLDGTTIDARLFKGSR
jgi:hypothetical protein